MEWEDILSSDPTAAREHVQSDTLAKEDVSCLASDGRDVLHGLKCLALLQVPFDPTPSAHQSISSARPQNDSRSWRVVREIAQTDHSLAADLSEHLGKERCARKHRGLAPFAE